MKFVLFCHSLTSDWNHGNAHFLRGITTELLARGFGVDVYEPLDGWSLTQLLESEGASAVDAFRRRFPQLKPRRYLPEALDVDKALDGADVVLVHEWNPPELLRKLGAHRRRSRRPYLLFFHDTHHRAVSAPEELEQYPLEDFDGTLAFGEAVAEVYRRRGWGTRACVWHEAADLRVFTPGSGGREDTDGDLVWIGNWGDDERSRELAEFLFEPARATGARGAVYGVRYPAEARAAVIWAGLEYRGWIANHEAAELYHHYRYTVHIPRRFYRDALPGVPTIRVFEALAAGIPLVCAPWTDSEGLFEPGRDFLMVNNGREMQRAMSDLRDDPALARELAASGRRTIERRHSCAHRVDELLDICAGLSATPAAAAS
jgi:spore maturation protein CgeB